MIQRSRNCYDTTLVYLFILGKEHLLPAELINGIPYSTKATWRTYLKEKFIGFSQRNILDEGIRKTELYHKYKHIKKILAVVETIYSALADMLDFVKVPIYEIRQYKERVLDLILQYKQVIPLDKLLHCFRISRSTYQSWMLELKVKCSASYFELCIRKYGSQLLKPQVELIREALTSDKYIHWPVASIAYYFQRMDLMHASVTTWYKYRRVLGIKRRRIKKSKKLIGLISYRTNEYWHIDITYFTTKNGVKHCIYFLSDNLSRKILAWRLAFEVNWKFVKECIEDAYRLAIDVKQPLNLEIVTDGGPENTHHCLDEFIGSLVGNIKKSIALKDIKFSNSPAEAKNKTFKSYYADEKEIENTQQLIEKIIFFIFDFNANRPMHVLKGFTPDEVYFDKKPLFDFVQLREQDAVKRRITHKNTPCKECEMIR